MNDTDALADTYIESLQSPRNTSPMKTGDLSFNSKTTPKRSPSNSQSDEFTLNSSRNSLEQSMSTRYARRAQQYAALQLQYDEQLAKFRHIKLELEHEKTSKANYVKWLRESEKDNLTLKQHLEHMQEKLTQSSNEKAELKEDLTDMKRKYSILEQRFDRMKLLHNNQIQEHAKILERESNERVQEKSQAHQQTQLLEDELQHVRQELFDAKELNRTLRTKVGTITDELSDAYRKLNESESQYSELHDTNKRLQNTIYRLENEITDLSLSDKRTKQFEKSQSIRLETMQSEIYEMQKILDRSVSKHIHEDLRIAAHELYHWAQQLLDQNTTLKAALERLRTKYNDVLLLNIPKDLSSVPQRASEALKKAKMLHSLQSSGRINTPKKLSSPMSPASSFSYRGDPLSFENSLRMASPT